MLSVIFSDTPPVIVLRWVSTPRARRDLLHLTNSNCKSKKPPTASAEVANLLDASGIIISNIFRQVT